MPCAAATPWAAAAAAAAAAATAGGDDGEGGGGGGEGTAAAATAADDLPEPNFWLDVQSVVYAFFSSLIPTFPNPDDVAEHEAAVAAAGM